MRGSADAIRIARRRGVETNVPRTILSKGSRLSIPSWMGNVSIHIEHEFFGLDGPSAEFRDRYGKVGHSIRGLTVEQHLSHLRERLLPLAERCGRVMREALSPPSKCSEIGPAKPSSGRGLSRSPLASMARGPEAA